MDIQIVHVQLVSAAWQGKAMASKLRIRNVLFIVFTSPEACQLTRARCLPRKSVRITMYGLKTWLLLTVTQPGLAE